MTKILVDTNIVLDIFLTREPFLQHSLVIWTAIEDGVAEGFLSAHAVTTIAYVAARTHGAAKTLRMIEQLLRVFGVAAVDARVLREAVRITTVDFEDAVTSAAAHAAGCDLIVTRDPAGFRSSPVRSVSPQSLIAMLKL